MKLIFTVRKFAKRLIDSNFYKSANVQKARTYLCCPGRGRYIQQNKGCSQLLRRSNFHLTVLQIRNTYILFNSGFRLTFKIGISLCDEGRNFKFFNYPFRIQYHHMFKSTIIQYNKINGDIRRHFGKRWNSTISYC